MRSTLPLFAAALAASAPVLATETIPEPEFRSVELRGGGEVRLVPGQRQIVTIVQGSSQISRIGVERGGVLRIDSCIDHCPSNYRLRLEIQSPQVPDLAVNGGGLITAENGFRPQSSLSAALNGGGKIDVRSLDAESISAAVNGGGELLVHPRNELSAAVNGGGHVVYWGNPVVSSAIRGGGQVSRAY